MHNVIPRICCNNCNPCTLDPLDTNSRGIIQITTPSRASPSLHYCILRRRIRPTRVPLPLFRTERVCHSNSNLKQSLKQSTTGFFVVSTLRGKSIPDYFLPLAIAPKNETRIPLARYLDGRIDGKRSHALEHQ